MTFGSRCRIPGISKMEVCVSIINSRKQRRKYVAEPNYSPVAIKPHGTISTGFVDQNTVLFKEKLDWLKFKSRFLCTP